MKDLACLSKLVGASNFKKVKSDVSIDIDTLTKLFRKSIYLLKWMNHQGSKADKISNSKKELWLNTGVSSLMTRVAGFPIYEIDIANALVRPNKSYDGLTISQMLDDLSSSAELGSNQHGPLVNSLSSSWFKRFVSTTLKMPYPVERFTILIAIWIVGAECNHEPLEQLIGELVDQIYHEETNSCNE